MKSNPLPLTPRMVKILGLALTEARRARHKYIGTEHFLLAILREGEGYAARRMRAHGIRLTAERKKFRAEFGK